MGIRESKTQEALDVLTEACNIDPYNPQLRFQRVHVLLSMKRDQNALDDLEIVKTLAPREPPVYSLLARLYHRMGKMNEAIQHFNTAVDLDPKGEGPVMKATLEGYTEGEEEEEEEEEEGEGEEEDLSGQEGYAQVDELNRSYGRIRLNTDELEDNDDDDDDDGHSLVIDLEEDPDLSDSLINDPNADKWGQSFDEDSDEDREYDIGDGDDDDDDDDDDDVDDDGLIQIHDGYDFSADYQSPSNL